MKTKTILGMACVLSSFFLCSAHTVAQNTGNSAQSTLFSSPELDFFSQYVLGKEFVISTQSEGNRQLDGGKAEADFDRKTRYSNLAVSPEGFSFNVLYTIKQTNYDLDAAGKRILPGRVVDRTFASRHVFGRSKSTGKIVGHRGEIFNDSANANFGMARNMVLFMEDNKLVMITLPGGYSDFYAAGGKFKPGTIKIRTEFVVKDGKIISTSVSEVFDVDPETMQMTPTGVKNTTVNVAEM